mmetsp:Transcript_2458/g.3581  ORF Transcript_2458/g.3581 Transcript_2458/m.3581 type:complete len:129 (+) Transcript_2458:63-449(+)
MSASSTNDNDSLSIQSNSQDPIDSEEQYALDICFQQGIGIKNDEVKETAQFYQEAAKQGDAQAQYDLGVCYHHGIGVEKDMKEAVKLYQLAAKQGHAEAKFQLEQLGHTNTSSFSGISSSNTSSNMST